MRTVLKLLGPAWTRAGRCVWMLEELGVPYELIEEQARPTSSMVRKYNPSGKVPVLLEYDNEETTTENEQPFVLTESVAINTYLGDKYYGYAQTNTATATDNTSDCPPLFVPRVGSQQRAHYDQTVLFLLSELDAQGMWMYRKHVDLGQYFGSIPEMAHVSKRQFQNFNVIVASQCHPYLLGKHFTAADILYVDLLGWWKSLEWSNDDKNSWPENLDSYLQLCHARPAYQRALQIQQNSKKVHEEKVNRQQSKL